MAGRRWLVPLAAVGAALLYRELSRGAPRQAWANFRRFSMPSAGLYDLLSGWALERFYAGVARQVVSPETVGTALDAGCGPGRLAVQMARLAPGLSVVGLDVSRDMVARAGRRAEVSGLAGRVWFQIGDVGTTPFADEQFELVVSTLSMHHWPDPARGLAEIRRVLKPGGRACVYDVAEWFVHATHDGRTLSTLAVTALLGPGVKVKEWKLGGVPLFRRICLRRE